MNCPNCNEDVDSLVPVDAGLKLRMQADGSIENIPIQICQNCIGKFSVTLSQGAILRKEMQAKEQNRMMLWRSRVQLVKQAKTFMNQKNFSDAAVTYEKYLRVLEIVYDKKSGELAPDLFNNEARRSEMTVITSVYWDLMRIYDSSPKHVERLEKSADKLAAFARFTPIFSSIVRRAESEAKSAKNPKAFKRFLSKSQSLRARCFIATSAFEYESPTVMLLCEFRDQILLKNFFGRKFVDFYYFVSPWIAAQLDRYSFFKPLIRLILFTFSNFLKYLLPPPPQN